jgi:hypothetical protein
MYIGGVPWTYNPERDRYERKGVWIIPAILESPDTLATLLLGRKEVLL